MLASIPKGVYTMKNKLVIILNNAELYRKANKKQKSKLLKELSLILHMNKQYISSLLRNSGKKVIRKSRTVVIADPTLSCVSKRGRKKVYDDSVEKALRIKALLLKVSHSTVDRLLKPCRDRIKLKQKYRSNPFSSNLKKSIMVESWFDKPKQPGYLEIDLVHHSGASGKGEFIYTLTATEVSTGWTELRTFRRVLNLPDADASTKDKLVKLRGSIDIVRLAEEIEKLSKELSNAYEKKLRRINSEQTQFYFEEILF